jgi:hypothetical protein
VEWERSSLLPNRDYREVRKTVEPWTVAVPSLGSEVEPRVGFALEHLDK